MPGPLSCTPTLKRSEPVRWMWTQISGRMPASSQASRALSTASLTVVSRALRGLSKPSRWRFLAKNSLTEMSRWLAAIEWAVARRRGRSALPSPLPLPLELATESGVTKRWGRVDFKAASTDTLKTPLNGLFYDNSGQSHLLLINPHPNTPPEVEETMSKSIA